MWSDDGIPDFYIQIGINFLQFFCEMTMRSKTRKLCTEMIRTQAVKIQ